MRYLNELSYYHYGTVLHSVHVATLVGIIGDSLTLTEKEIRSLITCALLHDIGKIDISLKILNKPGRLDRYEFTNIKDHTINGFRRLIPEPLDMQIKLGVLTHHERYDGHGYPLGLRGDDIPYFGRIVAIADVFDALTSKRVYKDENSVDESLEIMKNDTGHFDPEYLKAFAKTIKFEYTQLDSQLLYI